MFTVYQAQFWTLYTDLSFNSHNNPRRRWYMPHFAGEKFEVQRRSFAQGREWRSQNSNPGSGLTPEPDSTLQGTTLPLHKKHCEQVRVFASTHWYYNLLAPSVCWTNHITIQRPLLGTAGEYSLAIPPAPKGVSQPMQGRWDLLLSDLWIYCYLALSVSMSVFLPSRWAPWDQEIWNTTQTDRQTHTHVFPSKHKWSIWEVIPGNSWEEGMWNSKGKGVNTKCLMGLVTSVGNGWHVLIPSFDMSHWMTCSDSHLSNTYSQTLQAKHWGKGGDI